MDISNFFRDITWKLFRVPKYKKEFWRSMRKFNPYSSDIVPVPWDVVDTMISSIFAQFFNFYSNSKEYFSTDYIEIKNDYVPVMGDIRQLKHAKDVYKNHLKLAEIFEYITDARKRNLRLLDSLIDQNFSRDYPDITSMLNGKKTEYIWVCGKTGSINIIAESESDHCHSLNHIEEKMHELDTKYAMEIIKLRNILWV